MTSTQELYDEVVRMEDIALRAAETARAATVALVVAKRDTERAHAALTAAVRQDPAWVWPAFRGGDCT